MLMHAPEDRPTMGEVFAMLEPGILAPRPTGPLAPEELHLFDREKTGLRALADFVSRPIAVIGLVCFALAIAIVGAAHSKAREADVAIIAVPAPRERVTAGRASQAPAPVESAETTPRVQEPTAPVVAPAVVPPATEIAARPKATPPVRKRTPVQRAISRAAAERTHDASGASRPESAGTHGANPYADKPRGVVVDPFDE